jgi:hypothetical protein
MMHREGEITAPWKEGSDIDAILGCTIEFHVVSPDFRMKRV